jgi:hypothetical protein
LALGRHFAQDLTASQKSLISLSDLGFGLFPKIAAVQCLNQLAGRIVD